MCSALACRTLHADGTTAELDLPRDPIYLNSMRWVDNVLYAVMRVPLSNGQTADLYARRAEKWERVARIGHGLTPPEVVRLELGYYEDARCKFLFSRTPARVAKGQPIPRRAVRCRSWRHGETSGQLHIHAGQNVQRLQTCLRVAN